MRNVEAQLEAQRSLFDEKRIEAEAKLRRFDDVHKTAEEPTEQPPKDQSAKPAAPGSGPATVCAEKVAGVKKVVKGPLTTFELG